MRAIWRPAPTAANVRAMARGKHDDPGETPTADFGFRAVPRDEKQRMVRGVFDSVARRYDLMNDLMSGGVHRLWKDILIDRLKPRDGMHLLDVAGGTGDIAFRFLKRAPGGHVTVCDINASMLAVGRDRAIDRGRLHGIDWVCGDAEALPFPDASVDAYTIAFGLRNVTDKDAALREANRVLRPGGQFLCLEFSQVALPLLGPLYDRYSFTALPAIGRMVAGDREAYQYLVESIRKFPPQQELAAMMRAAGFELVDWQNLSGGICAIHAGWRI
jgi:demethylmenaquinone methyltransferase/2-methoxy-6-polyprenyl-1,4-benzoquinol methylase